MTSLLKVWTMSRKSSLLSMLTSLLSMLTSYSIMKEEDMCRMIGLMFVITVLSLFPLFLFVFFFPFLRFICLSAMYVCIS
jgi:hypothetical protein